MHILFLAFTINPLGGSEPYYAWQYLLGALRNGNTAVLITNSRDAEIVRDELRHLGFEVPVIGLSVKCLGFLDGSLINSYVSYVRWQLKAGVYINRNLSVKDFDLAHHLSWGTFLLGSGLSKAKIKYVFGPCGYIRTDPSTRKYFGRSYRIELLRMVTGAILTRVPFIVRSVRKAEICLAGNIQSASLIKKMKAPRVEMFYDAGILASEINTPRSENSNRLVWVGRFMPRKGALLAIKVIAEISKEFPLVELNMIGDGPELKSAMELVSELEISKHVNFMGRLPWDEVQQNYKDCAGLLFTSLRDSSGVQVLEAAAKGLPVICLKTGTGVVDWLGSAGNFIVGLEPEMQLETGFALQIRRLLLLSNSDYRKASFEAVQFAEKNTWEEKLGKMETIYRQMAYK